MDDKLLSYYNRELAYLRKMGAEFSEKHPKIAGRIRLDQHSVEDPHVSRLIESFAFITSRIRRTIDDSFPELTEALMGLLYPDYHAPIPSMCIASLMPNDNILTPVEIKQGRQLTITANNGGKCDYTTCYDTQVLPIHVSDIGMSGFPVKAPKFPSNLQSCGKPQTLIKISIDTLDEEASLKDIKDDHLRLYINAQPQVSYTLYEYLLNHVTGIAIATSPNDPNALFLPGDVITPCGFSNDDGVIPFDGRTSPGHRLLAEYFTFPEKFLFVSINQLRSIWATFPQGFHIYLYLNNVDGDMSHSIDSTTLVPSCTPIVNLSTARSEGIPGNLIDNENKVVIRAPTGSMADVHTVTNVVATSGKGDGIDVLPFYSSGLQKKSDLGVYWHIRRENSHWKDGVVSYGTDTYISFVNEQFEATSIDSHWVISVEALCNNRDMPNKLPFGPDKPETSRIQGSNFKTRCLIPPTQTLQPVLDDATRWQLVTQLSLQHFTGDDGLTVLKDTLRLYDFQDSQESKTLIEGITDFNTSTTSARIVQEGRAAICRGTKIVIEMDEDYYSGNGMFLFGSVLNEFFAHFCTINSFVQTCLTSKQRVHYRHNWPPQNGRQVLL